MLRLGRRHSISYPANVKINKESLHTFWRANIPQMRTPQILLHCSSLPQSLELERVNMRIEVLFTRLSKKFPNLTIYTKNVLKQRTLFGELLLFLQHNYGYLFAKADRRRWLMWFGATVAEFHAEFFTTTKVSSGCSQGYPCRRDLSEDRIVFVRDSSKIIELNLWNVFSDGEFAGTRIGQFFFLFLAIMMRQIVISPI